MENVAEALKMAGMVLMFIIALSVSVLAISNVRSTADEILNMRRQRNRIY